MKKIECDLKDDIIFAEKVEKAWIEHDKGRFVSKSKDDFLKELFS